MLTLSASPAIAGDDWVNFHFGSLHDKSMVQDDDGNEYNINGINPGIGFEFEGTQYGKPDKNQSYRIGLFKNSYDDLSLYAGVDIHTEYTDGFGTGITFGVVSGYKDTPIDSDVIAAVVPRVHYIYKDYRAELSYMYGKYASAIGLTFGVNY